MHPTVWQGTHADRSETKDPEEMRVGTTEKATETKEAKGELEVRAQVAQRCDKVKEARALRHKELRSNCKCVRARDTEPSGVREVS